MTIQDLGSLGELVAAIATLGTLVYLALQIRQSSAAVHAATEQSIAQAWALALSVPAQNPENADVYGRGLENPDDLSEAERFHFVVMIQLLFNQYEQAYLSHMDGDFSERRWARVDNAIRFYVGRPGFLFWRREFAHLFTAEFAEYLERCIHEVQGRAAQQSVEPDVE